MCDKFYFNNNPLKYDLSRSKYCPQLFDDVISYLKINNSSKLLEIGSGTGQATEEMLKTGCSIKAIEIGSELATYTRNKLKDFKNFNLINQAYEDYKDDDLYDVVLSATAFHWINPSISYSKTYHHLREGGHLVLFWSRPNFIDSDLGRKIINLKEQKFNNMHQNYNENLIEVIRNQRREINKSGLFKNTFLKLYKYEITYTSEEFVMWLDTHLEFNFIDEKEKKELFFQISQLINSNGGKFVVQNTSDLYISQKI